MIKEIIAALDIVNQFLPTVLGLGSVSSFLCYLYICIILLFASTYTV